MAIIIRIDVDRPYGKTPFLRHLLSRLSSDLYFPRIEAFGYLQELKVMLRMLNERKARAYLFFRRCTLPSSSVLNLIEQGRHEIGLHLENSRSFESFAMEKEIIERHVKREVHSVSKHGSGGAKFGYYHYAPYEPEKYAAWGRRAGLKLFLGNLEDPTTEVINDGQGLVFFPAAFWLEPYWRDTNNFTIDWLLAQAKTRDIVLLVHPENVLASSELTGQFRTLLDLVETKIEL